MFFSSGSAGGAAKGVEQELEFLRKNPKISSGGSGLEGIYLFRGGKYWLFDNKPKPNKPFGDLLKGSKPANGKWPGIHFPGGVCVLGKDLILVYKNLWNKFQGGVPPGGKEGVLDGYRGGPEKLSLGDDPIRDEEEPDKPKGDEEGGAVINPDPRDPTHRKIKGNRVCRFIIKEQKCFRRGHCITVDEDQNHYPPQIIAAIKTSDNNWFFVNKKGQFCQRKDGSTEKVYMFSVFENFY